MYTADNICRIIEFLIDNIFVQFGRCLFCQVIGISVGTNCAPLLVDLFLYTYEKESSDNMIRSGHRRLPRSFDLCCRYIDDLIVFNNKKFWIISKKFLTPSLNTWILSKFSTFHWTCLLFIVLILVGVELSLRIVVTLSWNAVTCFLESS